MDLDYGFDDAFIAKIQTMEISQRPSAKDEYAQLPNKFPVCPRRGKGVKGTPIQLLVNWFRITFSRRANFSIFIYEVVISEISRRPTRKNQNIPPDNTVTVSRENARIAFWNAMRKLHRQKAFKCLDDVTFDDTIAFLPYPISPVSMNVDHPDKKLNLKRCVNVTLRPVGKFPMDPFNEDQWVVDFSQRFVKAIVTQRTRFSAVADDDIDFEKNWQYRSGAVYRIPRYISHGSREDDQMTVLPGIRAWLGLYASLKTGEHKELFINFGLVNSLFYRMDIDLITFYIEVCKEEGMEITKDFAVRLEQMAMSDRQRRRMTKLVSGLIVKATHALLFDGERSKTPKSAERNRGPRVDKPFLAERRFKIVQIGNISARNFKTENGRTMAEMYNSLGCRLRFPDLPLVFVRQANRECYLPMEVLLVHDTPQKYSKALDFFDSRRFIQRVCRTPRQYKEETDRFLTQMKLHEGNAPFLSRYGAELDLNFTECQGNVLEAPVIRDHEGLEHKLQEDRSYRIKEVSENPGPIVMDVIIPIDPYTLEPILVLEEAGRFYKLLQDKMRERGMETEDREPQVYEAQYVPDRSDPLLYDQTVDMDEFLTDYKFKARTPTVAVVVKDAQKKFKAMSNHEAKRHIILIYSVRGNDFYGRTKRICDRLNGAVTQNVDRDTVQKALVEATENKHAIFFNLALKINGKLGGINTRADVPIELHCGDDDLKTSSVMYVGIDVTHPGILPGKESWDDNLDASIAAMVGSYDFGATKYKTYYMAQLKVKETVERFDNQFHHLMMDFFEENNAYPKHVVIYRDGVSDSEIIRTCSIELNWIKGSWKQIVEQANTDDLEEPTFTYIVVQKRHYTRFIYPKDKNGTIIYQNIPSGTVVDETVVSTKLFDFWLAGQHGAIGTSRPIHYTVVYDEWKMSPDHIYEMTYRLCFLNARCRKPCALPAPVHYAHLACLQGKEVYRDFVRHSPTEEPTPERQARIEEALNVGKHYPGMPFV